MSGTSMDTISESWTSSLSTLCPITYTIIDLSTNAFPDSTIFSMNGIYLDISTSDPTKVNTFNLKISGAIGAFAS
jgi:hypothetical protein